MIENSTILYSTEESCEVDLLRISNQNHVVNRLVEVYGIRYGTERAYLSGTSLRHTWVRCTGRSRSIRQTG